MKKEKRETKGLHLPPKQSSRDYCVSKRATLILLLITLLLISVSACSVRTQPGKVWDLRGKMVTLAKNLAGLPYRSGGEDIDGFDCSGYVYYVYRCFGIEIPRVAKDQGKMKKKIRYKKAKPGDILVFKLKRRRWHSGIYLGKDYFIHAPNSKETVRKEYLTSYWRGKLKAVINKIDQLPQ